MVDRIAVNHFGTADVPDTVRLALRAYTGLFAVACHDWGYRKNRPSVTAARSATNCYAASSNPITIRLPSAASAA